MKKTLLIMLAVLLLFSFVSCKDSSDEIIAVYEEYKTTESILYYAYNFINYDDETKTIDYTVDDKDDINTSYFSKLLDKLGIAESATITTFGGKIEGTYEENDLEVEFKNVEIKYTVTGVEDEQTFKLSGTYKAVVTGEGDNRVRSTDYNFKLNDTEYSLANTYNSDMKYSRAIVNGKNVELRLLNSQIGYWA